MYIVLPRLTSQNLYCLGLTYCVLCETWLIQLRCVDVYHIIGMCSVLYNNNYWNGKLHQCDYMHMYMCNYAFSPKIWL